MQLPEAFISRTKALLGSEWDAFEQALNENSPVSIRLNPKKNSPNSEEIRHGKLKLQSAVSWASHAFYLVSRPVFTSDPLFHAGCYYVQEASSMSLEHFVKNYIHEPVKVLDLCAAPGGKASHLSATLPEASLLVANEVIRQRAAILSENLIKWGNPYTIVTNNDPVNIGKLAGFFDLIVCDMPCSGEGMFRKDPAVVSEWSVNHVKLCAERQKRIVADIFPSLKPGGILIYSTCTYNREENEDNIDWICRELGFELLEEPRRFIPHKTKGEGFFIAGLRKTDRYGVITGKEPLPPVKRGMKRASGMTTFSNFSKTWLSYPTAYSFFFENDIISAFPSEHSENYRLIKNSLKIVSAGITLGKVKRKDIIPAHALAMSVALAEKAFPRWDLDIETALKYLRKEALQNIPSEIPMGFVLVTYKNQALGFIKNIGNRANNLYPQEWRIRFLGL